MEAPYSIGEVAERVGLSPSALRYYESIGVLPEPERIGGRRRYDQNALDRLAMIDVAQRAGLTLRETAALLDGLEADAVPSAEWRELAQAKLAEVDALIARAHGMRTLLRSGLACDCLALDDIEEFRRACVDWVQAAAKDRRAATPP